MISQIRQWLNDRWPFSTVIRMALVEELPGGSSYASTLGSVILAIVLIQAVTGILQLFFYVPAADHAYNSINYLRIKVPFGWLIHNLHFWGANAMIIVLCFHISRVFIWGAYKRPHEFTWLLGVALLLVTMGLSFTGGPLPWDQKGYWAAEVGTSIPGSIPIVGEMTTELMRGGPGMGQLTISRFFVLHAAIFPALLIAIIGAHIISFRTTGIVGPWDPERRKTSGPFWPDQAFKDIIISSTVIMVLIFLSVFFPPDFTGAADPLSSTFTPKPDWDFLFLYQALKYFSGPLEPVGVAGIPAVLVLLFVALPFIDRNPERNPLKRPVALAAGGLIAATLIMLTIAGYVSKPATSVPGGAPSGEKPAVQPPAESAGRGQGIFQSLGCSGCHKINGAGGSVGPDLSNEGNTGRSREWIAIQVRNPKSHFPQTVMPAHQLNERDMSDLTDYLLSLKTAAAPQAQPATTPAATPPTAAVPAAAQSKASAALKGLTGAAANIIGNPEQGAMLFDTQCTSCHGHAGMNAVRNPGSDDGFVPKLNPIDRSLLSKDPQEFAENIDKFIQHGSTPSGPKPRLSMPSFGDNNTLTQQQIANLEAYILKLNGVERGQLLNPGISPVTFFFIAVPVFIIIMLLAGGIYRCLPEEKGKNISSQ